MKYLFENWRKFLKEGQKVMIYRALPATTTEIRNNDYVTLSRKFAQEHAVTSAIYNGEPFYVVRAFVDDSKIKEADNPGEYRYTGESFEAKPTLIADEDGNVARASSYKITEETLPEVIEKSGEEYCLKSKKKNPTTGKRRNLGCYPTKAGAEKREKQVQYFKHKGS